MHILEDTVTTYLLYKRKIKDKESFNLPLALRIAMLHDLYTESWQNNPEGAS